MGNSRRTVSCLIVVSVLALWGVTAARTRACRYNHDFDDVGARDRSGVTFSHDSLVSVDTMLQESDDCEVAYLLPPAIAGGAVHRRGATHRGDDNRVLRHTTEISVGERQRWLDSSPGVDPTKPYPVDFPMFVSSGTKFPQSVSLQSDPQFGVAMGWFGGGFSSMTSPRRVGS